MPPIITGKMMLIDSSICIACKGCQVSCKAWHQLPAEDTSFIGSYQNPPDLSGITYTMLRFNEVAGLTALRYLEWLFFKDQCRHCVKPKCRMICPVPGAIVVEPSGAVVITDECNPAICVTRPCEWKCPYNVPQWSYIQDGEEKGDKEKKCDFCYDRIADGKVPTCVTTCPSEAITFGDVAYIQGLANTRLAELRANYPDANIYPGGGPGGPGGGGGGHGTHVIWLLIDNTSAYGIV